VIIDMATAKAAEAERLRAALADHMRGRRTFRTAQVENAFRTVPRHVFLPTVDLEAAYAPRPVVTKRAEDGTAISATSSPCLVAEMLELLAVQPGQQVLEIGSATGINTALLAELTGLGGRVVTVELDDDLAAHARTALTVAGYPQVEVVHADGAHGYATGAPYDRIIVTAGAWDIAPAWWRQLRPGGRLVVPLRLHGSGLTRVLSLHLDRPGEMVSTSATVCGLMPLRGAGERPDHQLCLHDGARPGGDVTLHVDLADLPDEDALTQALSHPAHEHWTGITVRDDEPAEHLDLWLATCISPYHFGRLSVGATARAHGLVDPAPQWAGATLYDGGTLAYLTVRPHGEAGKGGEGGQATHELGIVAYGPDARKLAVGASELVHHWDQDRPDQPTITARPAGPTDHAWSAAHLDRPHTRLTITW
jgi:protein-L-isoaspartate(D-aspartate) O-methyltransferase